MWLRTGDYEAIEPWCVDHPFYGLISIETLDILDAQVEEQITEVEHMPTEAFTVEQFTNALPKDKKRDNEAIFAYVGFLYNEHCFAYEFSGGNLRILIRSSIGISGVAEPCGEDSIRLIIEQRVKDSVNQNTYRWVPIGKGPDAYTTRVKGWERRLDGKIREIWAKAKQIKGTINDGELVRFSKKETSKNRPFVSCAQTGAFLRWLDVSS